MSNTGLIGAMGDMLVGTAFGLSIGGIFVNNDGWVVVYTLWALTLALGILCYYYD